jgi:hypothetical protein
MSEDAPGSESTSSDEETAVTVTRREPEAPTLRRAQADAQLVLERTLDTFTELSETAFRLIRVNSLVMTILLAGASQVRTARYLNALTVGAVVLFVVSVLFAVVSYTSRRIESGVGPDVFETAVRYRLSEAEYLDWMLSEGYGNWIERGIAENDYRERWIRYSFVAFLTGMVALIGGTILSLY